MLWKFSYFLFLHTFFIVYPYPSFNLSPFVFSLSFSISLLYSTLLYSPFSLSLSRMAFHIWDWRKYRKASRKTMQCNTITKWTFLRGKKRIIRKGFHTKYHWLSSTWESNVLVAMCFLFYFIFSSSSSPIYFTASLSIPLSLSICPFVCPSLSLSFPLAVQYPLQSMP